MAVGAILMIALVFDDDNSVKMIGHDHELIQRYKGETLSQVAPGLHDSLSALVQNNHIIPNLSKQTFPALNTDGHKIHAGLCIIEFS